MNSGSESSSTTIAYNLLYWTSNERQSLISDDNVSAFCYHEKESRKQDSAKKPLYLRSQYHSAKQQYVESRGRVWTLPNKRSDRLSDSVKELEEILKSNTVLYVRWEKRNSIQLVVNTGLLVNILMSEMNDIQKIFVDKSLQAKIPPELGPITSASLTDKYCLLCFDERDKLGFVSFLQRPGTPDHKQMTSKISSMDMRLSFHDIPGAPPQRGCRKMCVSPVQDYVICWCPSHVTSTSPSANARKEDKANMILLKCSFNRLEVCSFIFTQSNPISVEFSRLNPNQVHSLERSVTTKNEVSLQYVTYECTQNRLQRLEVSLIPVKSGVLSSSRNSEETKLAVGCTDGTVLVYDIITKSSSSIRHSMVPSIVSWHPNGGVIFVASGSAELQCFDSALNKLSTCLLNEMDTKNPIPGNTTKLSRFLPGDNGLVTLKWPSPGLGRQNEEVHEDILLLFDGGPLAVMTIHLGVISKRLLRPLEVIREHVAHDNINSAVKVLHTINWSTDSSNAFVATISIVNYLFKQPLSFDTEEQLEKCLSAFYAPGNPIAEGVVVEYRHRMSRYARRFFHHLLRFQRFEKAFLLAKDIQDLDLFVDLYFYAKESGDATVAKAAKQKMIELYSSSEDDSDTENGDQKVEESLHSGGGRRKISNTRRNANIMIRRDKPFKVTSPRLRKEIVPPSYPPPRMDDFMKSLISETTAVLEGKTKDGRRAPDEGLPKSSDVSTSTLKILDYGYV